MTDKDATHPHRAELYPQHRLPIAGDQAGTADAFDLVREQLLLGYGYNTARAYWGDLEHWRDWCRHQEPEIEPLGVTAEEVQKYLDWLAKLDYSPNTRARRLTTLRAFYALAMKEKVAGIPATLLSPVSRRNRLT